MTFLSEMYEIGYYILDDEHRPVTVDLMTWARWHETERRTKGRVGSTETDLYWVSTMFLGLDHNYGEGPPILFETMVFERQRKVVEFPFSKRLTSIRKSLDEDGFFRRYSTWDDAEAGHNAMVRRIVKMETEAKAMLGTKT